MALGVITNTPALNAQRNLNQTQSSLNTAIQRLTSGYRINSAKDDAAGSAISNRFTAQINGLNQASRNANDGISMSQTAEGSLQTSTDLLQRMRTLAVQASNDTNSTSDRDSIQTEMDQLYSELDRVASTTQFNGVKLLDGSGGTRTFQVGANSGETMSLTLASATTQSLNLNAYSGLGQLNGGRIGAIAQNDTIVINGTTVTATNATPTVTNVAADINAKTGTTGVTASTYNVVKGLANVTGVTGGALTIQVGSATAVTIDASSSLDQLATNINKQVGGIAATIQDGALVLSNDTGATITVGGTVGNSGLTVGANTGYLSLSSADQSAIAITAGTNTSRFGFNTSTGASVVTGSATTGSTLAVADNIKINGVAIGATTSADAVSLATAINAVSSQTGVKATGSTSVSSNGSFGVALAANVLTINGKDVGVVAIGNTAALVTAINGLNIGITAAADTSGIVKLTSNTGSDITIAGTAPGNAGFTAGTTHGTLTLTGENGVDVKLSGTTAGLAKLGLVEQGGSEEAISRGLSVSTVANASNAIKRIDEALAKIDTQRGTLGAFQNRMQSTISNLANVSENLTGARGRIMDTDFAQETAQMTKMNILQQAGIAMLSQSNQNQQQVLSLLR